MDHEPDRDAALWLALYPMRVFHRIAQMTELIQELRRHEKEYPSLVHAPLCGEAAAEIEKLRSALVIAGAIMQRAVDVYYVASGKMVIDDQDGYGPLREMRIFLEGPTALTSG